MTDTPLNVDTFMPNKEDRYAALVARIPNGWGRWIEVGDGWADLVINLDRDIAALNPDYELHQCKEKFGGLRYYTGHTCNDACSKNFVQEDLVKDGVRYYTPRCRVYELIRDAEYASHFTCETCGEPGVLRRKPTGWYRTLCDKDSDGYELIPEDDDED